MKIWIFRGQITVKNCRNLPITNPKAELHNIIIMHTPSLVKIRWCLQKLSSGNKNTDVRTDVRQTDGRTGGWTDTPTANVILWYPATIVLQGIINTLIKQNQVKLQFTFLFHYENTPIQIYRKFHLQKLKKFRQKLRYFSYFCSKHRLWVLIRTASSRLTTERKGSRILTSTHNLYFRAKIRKIMYTRINPSFTV